MTVTLWIPVTGGILQWAVSDYNGYLSRPTGPTLLKKRSNSYSFEGVPTAGQI